MPASAEYRLECEGCGIEETGDLKLDESLESTIDKEGWFIETLPDKILCGDCYERENP